MPLAATGLVICWNLPMNRARSSHSSGVAGRRLLEQQPLDEIEHRAAVTAGAPLSRQPDRLADVAAIVLGDRLGSA